MSNREPGSTAPSGWRAIVSGFPWFAGKGNFPLPAYSEFMPPPRLGRKPCGLQEPLPFLNDDPFGWQVTEIEEAYELAPGLEHLAGEILGALKNLAEGKPEYRIAGHRGRNLAENPYYPGELLAHAGRLPHERYAVFLPLALSRTQDDMGRVRWTFFGSSEQGPERAFWEGFYSAPGRELEAGPSLAFLVRLLAAAYGEDVRGAASLRSAGLRILPSEPDPRFPYWTGATLPSWTAPLLIRDADSFAEVRYLLTFRPFVRLPEVVKERYFSGGLVLLPFPGSLVFWGEQDYLRLQRELPLAIQIPLQRFAARHGAPGGLRIPQTGWLHEEGSEHVSPAIQADLLVNTYKRTSRWNRVRRDDDNVALSRLEDKVARVLFSTGPDALGLYDKPLARNCQIWTEDSRLLLDGPRGNAERISRAAETVARGGLFRYRFAFPAMQVGRHEIYWHRPLVAYWSAEKSRAEVLADSPLGALTAYPADSPDPSRPLWLWPRLLRREPYLAALGAYDHLREHYAHQTPLNLLTLFDAFELGGGRPLSRDFARRMLRLAEEESLDSWLAALSEKAADPRSGPTVRREIERIVEAPAATSENSRGPAPFAAASGPLTFSMTATRAFEERLWNDISYLAHGRYRNKDNADCAQDPATLSQLAHRRRDLEALGDELLRRHREAIVEAGLEGKALCGEVPFQWTTDFAFPLFGGWQANQDGRTHERDILVVIPGTNRREAVILADHYDTAYMEDVYDTSRGGSGARISAAGADDNHSATATLLAAAPIFLKLAKEGRLARDIWLLHLTGEEFPADCLGARHFCRDLVEGTLRLRLAGDESVDLAGTRVTGVFVMDMIAHNSESGRNEFQLSPGVGAASLELARIAHEANRSWNAGTDLWNRSPERKGRGRGKRSPDGRTLPEVALHPRLVGEVRTADNPLSSLFNTDGQIFSDIGVPVALIMENYDIDRSGYHDTRDTMANIDLDYGAAMAAIAIEAAALAAARQ